MLVPGIFLTLASLLSIVEAVVLSAKGVEGLVQRRLPSHVHDFSFEIKNATTTTYSITDAPLDHYVVSNGANGTIHIAGNSGIALSTGLRWYLTTYCHVDMYWFLNPTLNITPSPLPKLNSTYFSSSIVPWRYHMNTVTFDYTMAFWTYDDWELQLDWMALRGINLPLAWDGYEKILIDVFLEEGFTQAEIATFLSGPAFQAWNRFANIQGSWNGVLPSSWIEGQFELNKKIVARMVELGMTPVLPSFTGFVPTAISRVAPNASFVNGSAWEAFPTQYTNVTFLEPFDPLFTKLQKSFISKQAAAYGNVTHIYTLDQYNENNPYSGDLAYLKNVTINTIASLKAADSNAVWLLQGWLFYSSQTFWTDNRTEAYLSGASDKDMLILDLFSESQPQWQRTNNYYGKPWIWCMLHDYGGNMGLYGQVENITYNPVAALQNKSSTMVGIGLTMEGEEGNEIMYDLVLDQAWSGTPLDSDIYFHDWVSTRYAAQNTSISTTLPQFLFTAWDLMRTTVYNNTNLTNGNAVTKSILELSPNTTGLLNRTGHHPTTINYPVSTLVKAWQSLYNASHIQPSLWSSQAYTFDLTDVTRQVLANAFYPLYTAFVTQTNSTQPSYNPTSAISTGQKMLSLLTDLDSVLLASANPHFQLSAWFNAASTWANATYAADVDTLYTIGANETAAQLKAYYNYNALNQITLWGPTGQINDYASKQWSGLVGGYYKKRWEIFIDFTLNSTTNPMNGANAGLSAALLRLGEQFDLQTSLPESTGQTEGLKGTIEQVVGRWPDVFWGA